MPQTGKPISVEIKLTATVQPGDQTPTTVTDLMGAGAPALDAFAAALPAGVDYDLVGTLVSGAYGTATGPEDPEP